MIGPQQDISLGSDANMGVGTIIKKQDMNPHYTFKGRGRGNLLKSIRLTSKLPKSIQSMAFISNKQQSKNTPTGEASSFNIYGENIIDTFYVDSRGTKTKSAKDMQKQYLKDKNNLYQDWANSYNSLFIRDNGKKKSLNKRQIQKKIVSVLVHGTNEQAPKPMTQPRLLPLSLSLTLDGISGIYQGNSLRLLTISDGGVLPDRYKETVLFQVTKVQHGISDAGWTTSLECMMRMIPKGEL